MQALNPVLLFKKLQKTKIFLQLSMIHLECISMQALNPVLLFKKLQKTKISLQLSMIHLECISLNEPIAG